MRTIMMKSKIHRARVTAADVDYEGSITIDAALMEAAGIRRYEQVHVFDVTNGERLVTYALPGNDGEICINGAAARRVRVGDEVIILSFGGFAARELEGFQPRLVKVDAENRLLEVDEGHVPPAASPHGHHGQGAADEH